VSIPNYHPLTNISRCVGLADFMPDVMLSAVVLES